MPTAPSDSRDFDAIDPRLEDALARDGISLTALARLVDVDVRVAKRWGDGQKLLADFVAGRARAVRGVGGPVGAEPREAWVLEVLADRGIAPVVVAQAADEVARALAEAARVVAEFSSAAKRIDESSDQVRDGRLTRVEAGYTVASMNKGLLKKIASEIRSRSRGRMVMFAFKAEPDFTPRLAAAAADAGMSQSDFVRACMELHIGTPQEQQQA